MNTTGNNFTKDNGGVQDPLARWDTESAPPDTRKNGDDTLSEPQVLADIPPPSDFKPPVGLAKLISRYVDHQKDAAILDSVEFQLEIPERFLKYRRIAFNGRQIPYSLALKIMLQYLGSSNVEIKIGEDLNISGTKIATDSCAEKDIRCWLDDQYKSPETEAGEAAIDKFYGYKPTE